MSKVLNLSNTRLIQHAVENGEGELVANGAFNSLTGPRTGRSPADRFLVDDALTHDVVDWGENNQPIEAQKFLNLWDESEEYLKNKERYTADLHVGASSEHYQPVRIENEFAWHNMFCQSLFIQPESFNHKAKDVWQLRSAPGFKLSLIHI